MITVSFAESQVKNGRALKNFMLIFKSFHCGNGECNNGLSEYYRLLKAMIRQGQFKRVFQGYTAPFGERAIVTQNVPLWCDRKSRTYSLLGYISISGNSFAQ